MRARVKTGAPCAGHFVARFSKGNFSQHLVFEDSRGFVAPFGRKHYHQPVQGELMLWPSWAPHAMTPNPAHGTNIYLSVLIYPPGGSRDFDWEDDTLGDVVEHRSSRIQRAKKPAATESADKQGRKQDEL